MSQLLKSSNMVCLIRSLKHKEKQYEELKVLLKSPINIINNKAELMENQIETLRNKIALIESTKEVTNKSFDESFKLISDSFENKLIKSNECNTRQLLFNEENMMLTIRILEEKIMNFENKKNLTIGLDIDQVTKLNIYPKTISISASANINKPLEYFYENNKLYQNNNSGNNYYLVNGYYFIAISNNDQIVNRAWNVQNGELTELTSYFDGSNTKLIIDSKEYVIDGSIILTSDLKIWIRINNCWISK